MEWIPPEHQETHDFLIHWGRWLRFTLPQGHCASIEHRYRPPPCWYPLEPRPEEPDIKKAELVEQLMRIVPKYSRKILKFRYLYRADREWMTKRLRSKDLDQEIYTARQIIKNLLWAKLAPTIKGRFNNLRFSDYVETAA